MNSEEEKNDFISSSKIEEMGTEKVVMDPKKNQISESSDLPEKKSFTAIYFVLEAIVAIAMIMVFIVPAFSYGQDEIFANIASLIAILFVGFSLLNTYFFLFKLEPRYRVSSFIIRFSLILVSTTFFVINMLDVYFDGFYFAALIVSLYAISSQFILKIYLLTSKKSIKERLFRRAIAGSPSELEWRKFDVLSGYLAIFFGIFLLQIFWLIYHGIVRKPVIEYTKKRLVVESLEFGKDVNLTSVSLEIGIPLEEAIFKLKQLSLKRQLRIEFTRYGAILNEIRSPKWYSNTMHEKYENFLHEQKKSELEIKVNKFIELAARDKLAVSDFRMIMGINPDFPIKNLELLLPNKVLAIRKPLFSKIGWVYISLEHAMLKREKIVNIFIDNSEELFG